MKKKLLQFAAVVLAFALAGCSDDKTVTSEVIENPADMVVYGTIYTVEDDAPQAEAFAVKDGKYVYVGSADGAKAYIGENTTVVDHRGKGMITPGFADCHAHYFMSEAMKAMGSLRFADFTAPQQLLVDVAVEYQKAKAEGKPGIYGFGWTYQLFEALGMPTIKDLDELCPDIPLYLSDAEGHKALVNTACLRKAGIMDAEGRLKITEIKGGEICVDELGNPTGLLLEQAGTYCKLRGIDFNVLLDEDKALETVANTRDALISKGYVAYQDGWSNYFGNLRFYDAAKALDKEGKLSLNLGMAYEIESSTEELDKDLESAFATAKYTTTHLNPHYIKFFIDGTVETETGYVQVPYLNPAKGNGIANWTLEDFKKITAQVNGNNYTMHVHAMGDLGIHLAVEAFAASGKKEMRNTLVHVRNVLDTDYKVMADNDIVVTSGFHWHFCSDIALENFRQTLPEEYVTKMYPIKSYFDNSVIMSAHTDYPALSGSSEKPFDMMEIACTGVMPGKNDKPFWAAELINRQQALKALTINGAYQMHSEKERGSIKVGKYADFVIVNKDVMDESCPVSQIHTANVTNTFFEGKQVYPTK
ncbi:MAG: amidohydrolase [Bacteroidaceae bacterium]|nr:amidohydrolase [Bacteroidaceae bacterium]